MTYPFSVHSDEFKDKRVLVTGGTKGMGAAMVERFRISGAKIATTARSEPVGSKENVLFIKADISTPEGTNAVTERLNREWGGLDILVNNVGGTATKRGGFEVLTDEDWQTILDVNLLGAVRLDRAFLSGMLARRSGAIIHIGSVAGGCRAQGHHGHARRHPSRPHRLAGRGGRTDRLPRLGASWVRLRRRLCPRWRRHTDRLSRGFIIVERNTKWAPT